MNSKSTNIERHCLSVLVDDEPGVLARVVGLFSGRGYNIESLTVASVNKATAQSRISIVTCGSLEVIEQICAQLGRLVPVRRVVDLTRQGEHVEREMALIKVVNKGMERIEAMRLAEVFRARIIDASTSSLILEITGNSSKIDSFVALMQPIGMVELVRTGVAGMGRGAEYMEHIATDDAA
ncbi:MAG: acetolactate synthase small subunit [Alphaproteobacteria bacterium]